MKSEKSGEVLTSVAVHESPNDDEYSLSHRSDGMLSGMHSLYLSAEVKQHRFFPYSGTNIPTHTCPSIRQALEDMLHESLLPPLEEAAMLVEMARYGSIIDAQKLTTRSRFCFQVRIYTINYILYTL